MINNKFIKTILTVTLLSTILNGCSGQIGVVPALNQPVFSGNTNLNSANLLVKFKTGFVQNDINSFLKVNGIKSFSFISEKLKLAEIKLSNTNQAEAIKKAFIDSGKIEYIENDQPLTLFLEKLNQPASAKNYQGGFSVKSASGNANWPLLNINARNQQHISFPNNITVAVIDTGIDSQHADLKDNVLPLIDIWGPESGEDSFNGTDYKGKDGNGHGTHVSGIINSVFKEMGVNNIKILPVKAANHTGNTSASLLTKAILKAIDNGARVINMSIGGPSSEGTQALQETIGFAYKKGIVIVGSSGNDSIRRRDIISGVTIPSAYPGVISVAAVNKLDKVADYSNGGPEIDIAAAGGEDIANDDTEKIYSAWPTYNTYEGSTKGINGPHASLAGTSMASPFVAAAAALLLAKKPGLSAAQVRMRLLSTADDVEEKGFDNSTGFGRLNISKAISDDTDEL